ncbi:serine/threonine-protein phosphatase 6 regulatory subunit 1 isoform X2 [Rhinatrema bivittatum]|uniref:serine/threonine-protein phosphatase 6 regulatory subunit 1 isoform X2 n=1 Tax=Rhinatrema bivittatum TaxID=194408 RepID=UPI001128DA8D|nr:serine/threonine-protein phosphatase 6 regulatory subunit 1 isoform X2 [Rhinatrema bivittatum]
MFWKFDLHSSSHVDVLLEREDVTLFELLDEEDVLQECKVVNRKLVDFLLQPQHMEALVTCITQEPSADVEEKLRYKYPSVSCEILTADVSQINDALGEDEALLKRLYGFLQRQDGLNPLLASFFSKVMGILINRKTEQIVTFLRKKDDFVSLLLQHIGTSAIMDLLLRLLTCVEQAQLRQDVFNWLNEEKIVQRLIDMIHPLRDDNQHSNASQSLCDIVRLSREQVIQIQDGPEPDQLLATLEKQETIEQLLNNMFQGEGDESVIVNGIQVLLALLEPRRPRSELGGLSGFYCNIDGQLEVNPPGLDSMPSQASLGTLLAIRQHLREFHHLLLHPPKKDSLQTTWGILDPPLGNTRLHVVKLLASTLHANHPALNQELIELDTLNAMLDLYFTYVFNNFLHSQVELCVSTILAATPTALEESTESSSECTQESPLVRHLLQKCRLVQRILSAWEENEQEQTGGGRRKGYMGHLTRIANALVQSSERGPNVVLVGQLMKELPEEDQEQWEKFTSGSLSETNKKNTVDLVNTHNLHSSSDDEENDLKEFSFPQEAVLQQAFVDYQMQQMTSTFMEHFGFSDEEFGEQEESVNAPFDRTASITFSLNADDESPNSNLFEICYKERIQQFDDEEDEGSDGEDIWRDKESRFSAVQGTHGPRSSGSTDSEDSRDSEEEEEVEEEDIGGGFGDAAAPMPRGSCLNTQREGEAAPTSRATVCTWHSWVAGFDSVPVEGPTSSSAFAVDPGSSVWDGSIPVGSSPPEGWAVFSDLSSHPSSRSDSLPASPRIPLMSRGEQRRGVPAEGTISPTSAGQSNLQDRLAAETGISGAPFGLTSGTRTDWNGMGEGSASSPAAQTGERAEAMPSTSEAAAAGLPPPEDTESSCPQRPPLEGSKLSPSQSCLGNETQPPPDPNRSSTDPPPAHSAK